jgi:hypothetical protein
MWNYRIIYHDSEQAGMRGWYGLHEVYYTEKREPYLFIADALIIGESKKEIIHTLELALKDAKKKAPTLTKDSF